MDSITHTVLGACVGEALGGKKLGKKAMLIGAVANNVPDVDVVSSFWMKQADSLLAHRGFTHSILFALIFTFVAGWLMKKKFSRNPFSVSEWFSLIGINLFLHLIIDSFTAYGTGWYEPFSHERVAFNILFVADPFFTLPLLVAAIALLIFRKSYAGRKAWSMVGLIGCSVYFLYASLHKVHVNRVVEKSMEEEKTAYRNFITTPTPLNNFLWYVIAARDSGYDIGYYSVFDHSEKILFRYIPKNDFMLSTVAKEDDDVKKLIRFSQGYYQIEKTNQSLVFNDLRFGQIGGWFNGDAPFIFQFSLSRNADNDIMIQRGRMRALEKKTIGELIERIKGI